MVEKKLWNSIDGAVLKSLPKAKLLAFFDFILTK